MSIITLHSGAYFDFLDPKPESVRIEDVAHSLSHLARFTGHTNKFYSVAQHSCRVADMVKRENKIAALLHDSPEYVVGDMATPLKSLLPSYKVIERAVWTKAICPAFGLPEELPEEVKIADYKSFLIEIMVLFPNKNAIIESLAGEIERFSVNARPFEVWSSEKSYYEFIKRFEQFKSLNEKISA
jgi:hypothetical protein